MKLIKGSRTMRRYSIDGKPDMSDPDWLTCFKEEISHKSPFKVSM